MKQFSLQARLIAGFLGSLLVLLLVGAMMHRTIADYRNNLDWVNHTHEVIETLNGVTNGLQTIVSGQRIYLLQRTVLVVDDDPKAVQFLGTQLDAAGYRVLSAFGGKEGIETARKQLPDLIVLDLMMPEVNGFDVVEALKDETRTASIPVVVVTAKQITHEDRVRLNGNVLKVLEKSEFNHGRFLSEVRRAMSSGRS